MNTYLPIAVQTAADDSRSETLWALEKTGSGLVGPGTIVKFQREALQKVATALGLGILNFSTPEGGSVSLK